jgi:molecular chaperone DnaJ
VIEETEDPLLKRDGKNIRYDLYISFIDAALGCEVEVPTLTGKIKMNIEEGTQPERIMRLKGKGIKDLNGYGQGDFLVYVHVWVPTQLTKEEKAKLEKLRTSPNFAPNPDKTEKTFFDKVKDFFN